MARRGGGVRARDGRVSILSKFVVYLPWYTYLVSIVSIVSKFVLETDGSVPHHYGSMATLSMASRLMASHPTPAWNKCRHISDECVPHHALTSMATLSMAALTRSMATLSMATLSMTTLSMASLSMATRLLANRVATRSAVLVSGSSLHIYRVYS